MLPSVVLVYAFIIKIKIIYAGLKRAINEREGSLEILFFDSFLFPIRKSCNKACNNFLFVCRNEQWTFT